MGKTFKVLCIYWIDNSEKLHCSFNRRRDIKEFWNEHQLKIKLTLCHLSKSQLVKCHLSQAVMVTSFVWNIMSVNLIYNVLVSSEDGRLFSWCNENDWHSIRGDISARSSNVKISINNVCNLISMSSEQFN